MQEKKFENLWWMNHQQQNLLMIYQKYQKQSQEIFSIRKQIGFKSNLFLDSRNWRAQEWVDKNKKHPTPASQSDFYGCRIKFPASAAFLRNWYCFVLGFMIFCFKIYFVSFNEEFHAYKTSSINGRSFIITNEFDRLMIDTLVTIAPLMKYWNFITKVNNGTSKWHANDFIKMNQEFECCIQMEFYIQKTCHRDLTALFLKKKRSRYVFQNLRTTS